MLHILKRVTCRPATISIQLKPQGYFLSRASQKLIALLTANIYSYSDPARRHYYAFQTTIIGLYFERRDPIAFAMVHILKRVSTLHSG
jgi:hypothetical protein